MPNWCFFFGLLGLHAEVFATLYWPGRINFFKKYAILKQCPNAAIANHKLGGSGEGWDMQGLCWVAVHIACKTTVF